MSLIYSLEEKECQAVFQENEDKNCYRKNLYSHSKPYFCNFSEGAIIPLYFLCNPVNFFTSDWR